MTLRVYALSSPSIGTANGGGRLAVTGISGERLRVVTVGGVAAVVGRAARTVRPSTAALRAYSRVVSALAERAPVLLPVRFGTQVSDVGELTAILGSRQRSLRSTLRHLRGRVQMIIRVVDAEEPKVDEAPARSGTDYLRQRVRRQQVAGFTPIRSSVRRWVRDERVERHGRVATVYHLIPRAAATVYTRAVEEAAQRARISLVVTGPWPAYAFAGSW